MHNCLWLHIKLPGKGADSEHSWLPSKFWDTGSPRDSTSPAAKSQPYFSRAADGRAPSPGVGAAPGLGAQGAVPGTLPVPAPPSSARCFSWSSVPNAVTVWKQIGRTPCPPGTGHAARRDMLVAGCLHHLEALLNHLTASFVSLSSTKEKKKIPQCWKKNNTQLQGSRAIWKRESLQGFFEEKYSEFICPLQKPAISSPRPQCVSTFLE